MDSDATTTSCSALALIAAVAAIAIAPIAAQRTPAAPPIKPSPSLKKKFAPFPAEVHWSLPLNNALTAGPAFEKDFAYFPIQGDRIAAYDLTPGALRWIASAAAQSAPVVGGGLLFVDQGKSLTAFKTSDGSMAWDTPLPAKLAAPLALANDLLIAATAEMLFAYHTADGSEAWHRDIAGIRASPAATSDRVYLSLADGRVVALRLETGEMIWERKLQLESRIGGMPNEILASGKQLFVGSTDNYLYCLKADDGVIVWSKQTGADVVSRSLADEDNVYFVSLDNVLRALNRGHGVQQWMKALPFRPMWAPIAAMDAVVVAGTAMPPRAYFMKDGAPAEVMTVAAPADIVAPIHTFSSPFVFGPALVIVTRALSGEATVIAASRALEPPPIAGPGSFAVPAPVAPATPGAPGATPGPFGSPAGAPGPFGSPTGGGGPFRP